MRTGLRPNPKLIGTKVNCPYNGDMIVVLKSWDEDEVIYEYMLSNGRIIGGVKPLDEALELGWLVKGESDLNG